MSSSGFGPEAQQVGGVYQNSGQKLTGLGLLFRLGFFFRLGLFFRMKLRIGIQVRGSSAWSWPSGWPCFAGRIPISQLFRKRGSDSSRHSLVDG